MAEVILMPRLSDTMTEGVIAAWHKNVGDTVKKGDVLAEIETDKATMELESYQDGVLLHTGAPDGGKLQVNDLMAIIGKSGEDISTILQQHTGKNTTAPTPKNIDKSDTKTVLASSVATSEKNLTDLSKVPEVVLMPRLSDTMTEGTIAAWHKNVGDTVKKGDVLAEIETDKATMELESYRDGIFLFQGADAGTKIQVNDLLCIIGAKDFDISAIVAAAQSGGKGEKITAEPSKQPDQKASASAAIQQPIQNNTNQEDDVVYQERIIASPLAKKIAKEKGIDLREIKGSGDGGRIIKNDIDNYTDAATKHPSVTPSAAEVTSKVIPFQPGAGEGYADHPNSQMRSIIAKRLGESKFSAPHFYLKITVNMDNAIVARQKMNEASPVKISFNDLIIKASAMALQKHPAINSSWMGDFIRTYQHIHIGMAVAIPDGLIVPVIRFANQKSLSQIAAEAKELGGKAKNKKLQPSEFTGNTFTISNLGMMDIDEFTAIINPPDSCILAVGKIKEEVYRNAQGTFDVRSIMQLTLSCDHRSVDGSVGAAFLQTLKAHIENPVTMLI